MATRFKWRDQYDDARDAKEREASNSYPKGESLTIQSQAIDCDINVIVARFGIGEGVMPPPIDQGDFYDASNMPDLRQIMEIQRDAFEHFSRLPAKLRNRFLNDPARLWEFVQDAENIEEAISLGILTKKAPERSQEPEKPAETAGSTQKVEKTDT